MSAIEAFVEAASGAEGTFVVNVRYTRLTVTLVLVLRYLLNEREESGVVFSIDRPSVFLRSLLEHQHVPQEKLLYLDAVTRISGEEIDGNDKSELFTSPFCVNLFSELVSCHAAKQAAGKKGFVVVDNLAALKPYMTNHCVEKLVQTLKNLGKNMPGFKCIFVMDKVSTPELFDILTRNGAKEVSI